MSSEQPEPTETTTLTSDSNQELVEFVENLPEEKRGHLVQLLVAGTRIKSTFSGPLPPANEFEHYNAVLPGAADRILAMAEKEQQIRADGQAGMLANDGRRVTGATWIGLALIGVAGLAAWMGQPWVAAPLGLGGTVTALVRHVTAWIERRQGAKQAE